MNMMVIWIIFYVNNDIKITPGSRSMGCADDILVVY